MRAVANAPATTASRAEGLRCVVVASRFNGEIVQRLVDGAIDAFVARGADREHQRVLWVPGALEIPLTAAALLTRDPPDAIVCVGCVIRGGTDHYEHVCRAAVDGIMRVSIDAAARRTVVTNGVLTVATVEQAWERAGGSVGNKGAEAAEAAVETLAVLRGM